MNRKTVQQDFAEVVEICENIKAAGYDPVMQIRGYLETGDSSYITRRGDARSKIQKVDKVLLKSFVEKQNLY